MEKSATLNLRINPTLKSEAETVLSRLGHTNVNGCRYVPESSSFSGGIPFFRYASKGTGRYRCLSDDRMRLFMRSFRKVMMITEPEGQRTLQKHSKSLGRLIGDGERIVEITQTALDDMEGIYDYIADVLLAAENAMGQYNRIADAILTLESNPERCPVFEVEPERSWRMRRMVN